MPILNSVDYHALPVEETCVHIPLDKIIWRAIGEEDPRTRLIARVQIGGADHHLEAREMRHVDEPFEHWKAVEFDDDIDLLAQVAGDAFHDFTEIEGRTYLLFMTPYS